MSTSAVRPWGPIGASAAIALLVAFLGGTITVLGPWHEALKQPPWAPPDWLFAPAWTLIFALTALSAALVWMNTSIRRVRNQIVSLYLFNAALNLAWSFLFFRAQRPDWALMELILLWLSIVLLIVMTARYSWISSWLLIPYLAWVTFAGTLNLAIVDLNPAFG